MTKVLQCVDASCIDRIYIIDNSPTDGLRRCLINMQNTDVEYIFGQGNIGFGCGNNIGISKAFDRKSDFHIVLNPDIIFEPNVISELAKYMVEHSEVGQILPRVEYPDGRVQYLCRLLPTPLDIFVRRFLPKRWIKRRNARYEMHSFGYDKIWNCPILSGCFMFLNMEILKDVVFFDERFFLYLTILILRGESIRSVRRFIIRM